MQSGKLVTRSLRQHFDAAIVIIADPSGNTEHMGFALHKPAKADALHASSDEIAASQGRLIRCGHEKKLLIVELVIVD